MFTRAKGISTVYTFDADGTGIAVKDIFVLTALAKEIVTVLPASSWSHIQSTSVLQIILQCQ